MKNFDLNPGGLIGAVVCGAIAAAVIFSALTGESRTRGAGKAILLAVAVGGAAGNFLWARFFPKAEDDAP